MVDPGLALVVFGLGVVLVAALAWPGWGLVPRLRQLARLTERVHVEDALKHLHETDYRGQSCTVDSIAGGLELPRERTMRLVARLEALGLVRSEGDVVVLTPDGRAEARRVLRSHRLWERYLADRTGVAPAEWHDEAERREHTLSPGAVERLAAAMGDPVYDPHGDPIPTSAGELPPRRGVALNALEPGQTATIVHVEDEPRDVYERLVGAGLAPGARVEVREMTPERLRLAVDGEERVLEPVAATNVTVAPGAIPPRRAPLATLADLPLGEVGVVEEIAPACSGLQRRRLLDLGLVPGTAVRAELEGALSGAIAYRIRGALVALRRDQAQLVRIRRAAPGGAAA